jgi:hypothetical protein
VDGIAKSLVNGAVLLTPLAIGIGWWLWFRRDRRLSIGWRHHVLLIALLAVSANAILYYGWFAYGTMASNIDAASELKNTLGNDVAVPLVLVAIAGAIGGKGAARPLVALAAVMGFFLWLSAGIL